MTMSAGLAIDAHDEQAQLLVRAWETVPQPHVVSVRLAICSCVPCVTAGSPPLPPSPPAEPISRMLAEPRRKVKYGANPRGNEWVNDGSKFGQRMLEKMGWSKGKGLGAKEDGVTEHVKLGFRMGTEGLGWQEKDNNPELNANYEQALAELQQRHASAFPQPAAAAPLVAAVKTEAAAGTESDDDEPVVKRPIIVRHRYAKVLRAKDTSSYTKEDMAKIFAVRMEDDQAASPAAASPSHAPQSLGQKRWIPAAGQTPDSVPEPRLQPEADLPHDQDGETRRQKKSKKRKQQEERTEDSAPAEVAEEPDCEKRSKKRRKRKADETRVKIESEDSCEPSLIPRHEGEEEDAQVVGKHEKKKDRKSKNKKNRSKRVRTEQQAEENLESGAGDAAAAGAAGEDEADDLDPDLQTDANGGKRWPKIKSLEDVEQGLKRSGYSAKQATVGALLASFHQLIGHVNTDPAFASSSITSIRGYGH